MSQVGLLKRALRFVFGKDLWVSPLGAMTLTAFALQLWFVVDWCYGTTFRPMSDWMLWACNTVMALLLTLPYALWRRTAFGFVFLSGAALLLEANLMYYRTYLQAIPPDSYLLVGNLGDFTSSIADSLRWPDIGFPVIIATGGLLVCRTRRRTSLKASRIRGRYCTATALAALICALGISLRGGFYKAYDSLIQSCYYFTAGVPTYSVAGHIAYSLIDDYKADRSWPPQRIQSWLQAHDSHVAEGTGRTRRSLVLIVCESLESWPIGAEIDGRQITPYINSLVADSTTLFVPDVITQVGSGRSIDCQLLVLTGLMPMRGSVFSMKYPNAEYPSLAKAFSRKYPGAATAIYTADKPITWNQQAVARSFGFGKMDDRSTWTMDEMIGNPAKLSDGSFLRQSASKLKREWAVGTPRLSVFITYSGHNPFVLPDNLRDPDFKLPDLPQRLSDYMTMVHYTDSQLHALTDYLRGRPDYPDMLIVIVGDHEGLGNDRAAFHRAAPIVSPQRATPLIILNSPTPGHIADIAGQVDIYPTLLTLLGLEDYTWHGLGVNLLSPAHPAAALGSGDEGIVRTPGKSIAPYTQNRLRQAPDISDALIRKNFSVL